MKNSKLRLIVWAIVVVLILMLPLAMQFTDEVSWGEAAVYGALLLAVGSIYELARALRKRSATYRVAFVIGLVGALLLGWINGAVGIIGSEDNPANLLYGAVGAVGLIGSFISRFQPRGMACTLFTAAVVQMTVPIVALIRSPEVSWGNAGIAGVFVLSSFFTVIFAASGVLFLRAARGEKQITWHV